MLGQALLIAYEQLRQYEESKDTYNMVKPIVESNGCKLS